MRRGRNERGVTIVEAAFVLPLLMLFILTMVDLGQWAFATSQATSAARDGARAGIINYMTAAGSTAAPGGTDFATIDTAVKSKLAGVPTGYAVAVKCIPPDSETALTNGCGSAVQGCDRIMVTVTWNRAALSPFGNQVFGSATVSGKSIMVIAGAPKTISNTTTTTAVANNSSCV